MANNRALLCLLCSLLFLMFDSAWSQRAPLDGMIIDLNGEWLFKTDPNGIGESEGWFNAQQSGAFWDKMEVPGNWDLHNEYAHYVGKGWYQKSFTLPPELKDKTFILHFEAVYHDCTVWLNGRELGKNNSGFLPFEFEITPLLRQDEENTLTVCADNTFKRGAIWNWGGIRRPVTLRANEGVRVIHQHITPEVDLKKQTANVGIRLFLENHLNHPIMASGHVLLTAGNGFRKTVPFSLGIPAHSKGETVVTTTIDKKDFHLWHFDDPFIYRSSIKLNDSQNYPVSHAFGLRKIELDKETYEFKLNGESVRLMGLNLVPDGRTTGNTMPLWLIKQDVDLLKSLNGNLARLSHLPLPEEMLDYLDERGILIFSEIPLWGYDPLADPDNEIPFEWLDRLIHLQYNHPSIIGWSTGNEIGHYPTAGDYVVKSIDFVRGLDSTRLVSNVTYTAHLEDDYIRFTDIGLLNKYGKNLAPVTRLQHEKHPDKVLFYSEYGVAQFGEGLDATIEIKPLLDSLRNFPYLVGTSIWTYNDYRSSYVGTRELSENRPWGVVDTYRRKKQAYFDLQKEHAPIKEIKVNLRDNAASITLIPRTKLDLPAHPMRGYKMVYQLLDNDQTVTEGGILDLPDLLPNGLSHEEKIQWKQKSPYALEVSLLSPQMDKLLDTVLYFQKPPKPADFTAFGGRGEQNNVPAGSGAIRVFYDKSPHATAYKLKYGTEEPDKETAPGWKDFLDIGKLDLDQTYQVQLVAINPAGETRSDPIQVKVDQRDFLPPGVRYVEPAPNAFFVAYASDETDFLYRIKYREKGNPSSHDKIIQSRTPGIMAVRNLKNGQPYTFEVQRVTDNNSYSLWSKTYEVVPDGDQVPCVPHLKAVFRNQSSAILSFSPVSKATGYQIQYRAADRSRAEWTTVFLNRSEVSFGEIKGLRPGRDYEFRMAAVNAYGKSDYTQVMRP